MAIVAGRHYAYAEVDTREYALIQRLAARDGLSISNFVRRCVNAVLLEEGLDDELLSERETSPRRTRA